MESANVGEKKLCKKFVIRKFEWWRRACLHGLGVTEEILCSYTLIGDF